MLNRLVLAPLSLVPLVVVLLAACPGEDPPCLHEGQAHEIGASFPAADGCNTCSCTEEGVACTLIACLPKPQPDAGAGDAGPAPVSCEHGGKTYADGESFPSTDGCNTCTCSQAGVACTKRACLPPKPCVRTGCSGHICAETDVVSTCEFRPEYACYKQATCERQPDGACGFTPSPALTACLGGGADAGRPRADAGRDAGPAPCDFATKYSYGFVGGLRVFAPRSYLAPGNAYSHARNPLRSDVPTVSCAPPLPTCGAQDVITAYDVEVHDLPLPDVQAALAQPKPPLYGRDLRPVDGVVFEFLRADGRGFLVGNDCPANSTAACVPLPRGIRQLRDRLLALDKQQLAHPECTKVGLGAN
jgi:hypothetical protein